MPTDTQSSAPMAMLPNDFHPGPRCSCRLCLREHPDVTSSHNDARIRFAYSRYCELRGKGKPVGPGAYIEVPDQEAFVAAVTDMLKQLSDKHPPEGSAQ